MKGIYILIIRMKEDSKIKIAKLGSMIFKKGTYAYIGSGQVNLEKRIKRHLSRKKKMHWHIDYLLKNKNSRIAEVHYKLGKKQEECKTAGYLLKNNRPIDKFGSSDCKCASHLILLNNQALPAHFRRLF